MTEPLAGAGFDGEFAGLTVVVTGAAGTLGAAIGGAFSQAGARVWGVDRVARDDAPGFERIFAADVRDAAALRAARAALDRPVDILVNAAGLQRARSGIVDCDEALWDEVIDVNLNGVARAVRAFAADMKARGGTIVNLGSVNGVVVSGRGTPYGVAKAGVAFMTRALALELAPLVRVNCIAPTAIPSGMTADLFADPAYVESKRASIPLRRFGEPGDIVEAVLYLASRRSALITGHTLVMDGGLSLA